MELCLHHGYGIDKTLLKKKIERKIKIYLNDRIYSAENKYIIFSDKKYAFIFHHDDEWNYKIPEIDSSVWSGDCYSVKQYSMEYRSSTGTITGNSANYRNYY
jgi:GH25 family lysozyme M1 (1,4-beta-N-acetylmuramidase)